MRFRRRQSLDDTTWLRHELERRSLPADELLTLARLSAKLVPCAEPRGRTRLGGEAELPSDEPWPTWLGTPLAFLGQIDLAQAARVEGLDLMGLPTSGVLACFYEGGDEAWGFDPKDRGAGQVLFVAPDAAVERRRPPPQLADWLRFREVRCDLVPELTLPAWESIEFVQLGLDDRARDAYFDVQASLERRAAAWSAPKHRFLGHPDPIQDAMQLAVQLAANGLYVGDSSGYEDPRRAELEPGALDWRLLLQVDTDEEGLGVMWGDLGSVYLWLREADLRARRFAEVWPVFQCS